MRFTISQVCVVALLVALCSSTAIIYVQSNSKIRDLEIKFESVREHLRTVERGKATIHLLSGSLAGPENNDYLRFLEHELAISVLDHWKFESEIDSAVQQSGYSKSFVARALLHLNCKSAKEFVEAATSSWWIYSGDVLHSRAKRMSEADRQVFDTFLQSSLKEGDVPPIG